LTTWRDLGLLTVVLAVAACARPLGPLSAYNDRWVGTLTLRSGRALPLRLDVHVTRADERGVDSPPHHKRLFAELALDEAAPLAAMGEASHYNRLVLDQVVYSPIPGREFVELRLESGPGVVDHGVQNRGDPAAASAAYQRGYGAMLETIGATLHPGESAEVMWIAERQRTGRAPTLRGIVRLTASRTGRCTHVERGRCVMWGVEIRKAVLASFAVERRGGAPTVLRPSEGVVDTGAFRFQRKEQEPGMIGWSVEVQPRHSKQ
jgi:hypothetical protein